MATETPEYAPGTPDRPDRPGRRRPFSTWMKKLANFKAGSSAADASHATAPKRSAYNIKSNSKKHASSKNNNPYPESGRVEGNTRPINGPVSFSTLPTGDSRSTSSLDGRTGSASSQGVSLPTIGNKSTAAISSIDKFHSVAAPSRAASSGQGTMGTAGCGVSSARENDSTFSSPAPSVRSLTTTLTTIHSAAPNTVLAPNLNSNNTNNQFSHQFPTSPPPNALPPHLAPQGSGGHPSTYNTATANNLLTDNASILTLASSSKRRRRRSMDTDASVRALAPSSLFGGSRESLPLSVLSANIDPIPHQSRPSVGGLNERASIYSTAGVAPALPSERNSYYAGKQSILADGGSVKSGLLGHSRKDSLSGSILGGVHGSPLASPRDMLVQVPGRLSRQNSAWGEHGEGEKSESVNVEDTKENENAKDRA